MSGARMSAELPRRDGEDVVAYIHRLALYLGYLKPGPELEKKLDMKRREPGEDG